MAKRLNRTAGERRSERSGKVKGPTSFLSTLNLLQMTEGPNPPTDLLSAAPPLVFFFRPPSLSQRFRSQLPTFNHHLALSTSSPSLVRAHLFLLLLSRSSFNSSRWPIAQLNRHGQSLLPRSKRKRLPPTSTLRRTALQDRRQDRPSPSSPSRPSPSTMSLLKELRDRLTTEEYLGLQRSC